MTGGGTGQRVTLARAPRAAVELERVAVLLDPDDDVAITKEMLAPGTLLVTATGPVRVQQAVPAGHKVALHDVPREAPIRRYGQIIGFATQAIEAGAHVHSHNWRSGTGAPADYSVGGLRAGRARSGGRAADVPRLPPRRRAGRHAQLRRRARLGQLLVVGDAGRSPRRSGERRAGGVPERRRRHRARRTRAAAARTTARPTLRSCSGRSPASSTTRTSPATSCSRLGCEVNQPDDLIEDGRSGAGRRRPDRADDPAGRRHPATVEAGIEAVTQLLPEANEAVREPEPASKLVVALQCGGSDGNSGVTANPALGVAADLLVAPGRHRRPRRDDRDLRGRAPADPPRRQREVGEKLVERIKWWEWYTAIFGAEINNNPSPGQQGGRPDDDLREVARRDRQGRHRRRWSTSSTTPSRSTRARLRLHGHARLRPGLA